MCVCVGHPSSKISSLAFPFWMLLERTLVALFDEEAVLAFCEPFLGQAVGVLTQQCVMRPQSGEELDAFVTYRQAARDVFRCLVAKKRVLKQPGVGAVLKLLRNVAATFDAPVEELTWEVIETQLHTLSAVVPLVPVEEKEYMTLLFEKMPVFPVHPGLYCTLCVFMGVAMPWLRENQQHWATAIHVLQAGLGLPERDDVYSMRDKQDHVASVVFRKFCSHPPMATFVRESKIAEEVGEFAFATALGHVDSFYASDSRDDGRWSELGAKHEARLMCRPSLGMVFSGVALCLPDQAHQMLDTLFSQYIARSVNELPNCPSFALHTAMEIIQELLHLGQSVLRVCPEDVRGRYLASFAAVTSDVFHLCAQLSTHKAPRRALKGVLKSLCAWVVAGSSGSPSSSESVPWQMLVKDGADLLCCAPLGCLYSTLRVCLVRCGQLEVAIAALNQVCLFMLEWISTVDINAADLAETLVDCIPGWLALLCWCGTDAPRVLRGIGCLPAVIELLAERGTGFVERTCGKAVMTTLQAMCEWAVPQEINQREAESDEEGAHLRSFMRELWFSSYTSADSKQAEPLGLILLRNLVLVFRGKMPSDQMPSIMRCYWACVDAFGPHDFLEWLHYLMANESFLPRVGRKQRETLCSNMKSAMAIQQKTTRNQKLKNIIKAFSR
jgi:hypothetical protein